MSTPEATHGVCQTAQLSRPPSDFIIPPHLRLPSSGFYDPCAEGVASLIVLLSQKIGQWVGLSLEVLGRLAENERRKVNEDELGGEVFAEQGSRQALRAGLDWLTLHRIVEIRDDVVHPTELLVVRLRRHALESA